MKQFAILAVMVTFVINPVFACCHANAPNAEETEVADSNSQAQHKGCHDAEPLPVSDQPTSHNPMGPMDCEGCAECDAYYQKANEVALKVAATDLPSVEKMLAVEATIQIDVAHWQNARLRPPSMAPPGQLSPVQLKNILIL